jgi:hypothetical protein
MRNFRHLPPILRAASILGLLFPLASIMLLGSEVVIMILAPFPQWPLDALRGLFIAVNLGMLGGACSYAVNSYSLRFRQLEREPLSLSSWQNQAQASALLATLPLGAVALALVLPPGFPAGFPAGLSRRAFPPGFLAIGITLLAAVVLLVVYTWVAATSAECSADI